LKAAEDHLVSLASAISLGLMILEKEGHLLRLGALIGFLAVYHLGINLRSGCQFLHLRWHQWNQSNDLHLSILLSRRDGTTPGVLLVSDPSRYITIGSQDGDQEKKIITKSETMIRGIGDHTVMGVTTPMLSKEDSTSELRGLNGLLRELTGSKRLNATTAQNELKGQRKLNWSNE
jgi:hypothetical protein